MRIDQELETPSILLELGERLTQRRLDLRLSQAQLAAQAGVAKRTLERIEAGQDTQLSTLTRVLRALQLLDNLEQLVPPAGPRPMDLLELHGKRRRRVRKTRYDDPPAPGSHVADTPSQWRWGDES